MISDDALPFDFDDFDSWLDQKIKEFTTKDSELTSTEPKTSIVAITPDTQMFGDYYYLLLTQN